MTPFVFCECCAVASHNQDSLCCSLPVTMCTMGFAWIYSEFETSDKITGQITRDKNKKTQGRTEINRDGPGLKGDQQCKKHSGEKWRQNMETKHEAKTKLRITETKTEPRTKKHAKTTDKNESKTQKDRQPTNTAETQGYMYQQVNHLGRGGD